MNDIDEKDIYIIARSEPGGVRTHYGRITDSLGGSIAYDGTVYVDFDEGNRRLFLHMSVGPDVQPERIQHLTQEVSDDVFRLVAALRQASGTDLVGLRKKRTKELRTELAALEAMDAENPE